MAAPTVEVAAVTLDGSPFLSPYKLSRQETKDELYVQTTITWTGTLGYYQLRLAGTNRINGIVLERKGIVCGLGVRCGPDARSLAKTSGSPWATDVFHDPDFDEYLDAEGDYRVGSDALNGDGWSA